MKCTEIDTSESFGGNFEQLYVRYWLIFSQSSLWPCYILSLNQFLQKKVIKSIEIDTSESFGRHFELPYVNYLLITSESSFWP